MSVDLAWPPPGLAAWPPDLADPATAGLAALAGLLLVAALRAALRPRDRLRGEVASLAESVRALAEGQGRLVGELRAAADAQAGAEGRMGEALAGAGARTARSLGALETRLAAIDRAQGRIEKLSGEVLGLQDILANKQARGAFGEIQLADMLSMALPPSGYALQATLSNGRRADALIRLPHPPGPICVDAKFPLEAYEALLAAEGDRAKRDATRALRTALRGHVAAIAERYVIPGETAEGALMFLPSEAIFAELHANHGEVAREGFEKRVWIVSPSTLMATLTTLRAALRDARLAAASAELRAELAALRGDLAQVSDAAAALQRHAARAEGDLGRLAGAAGRADRRAARIEAAEFGAAPEGHGRSPHPWRQTADTADTAYTGARNA